MLSIAMDSSFTAGYPCPPACGPASLFACAPSARSRWNAENGLVQSAHWYIACLCAHGVRRCPVGFSDSRFPPPPVHFSLHTRQIPTIPTTPPLLPPFDLQ